MKIFALFSLVFLISCNSGGGGNSGERKSSSGAVVYDKEFREYINQSVKTLPNELKLTDEDKIIVESEVNLTSEESQTLNVLQ